MVMRKGIHFEPTEPDQGEDPEEEDDVPAFTLVESVTIYLIILGILSAILYLYITR